MSVHFEKKRISSQGARPNPHMNYAYLNPLLEHSINGAMEEMLTDRKSWIIFQGFFTWRFLFKSTVVWIGNDGGGNIRV